MTVSNQVLTGYNKKNYTRVRMEKNGINELEPLTVKLVLDWCTSKTVYEHKETTTTIEYDDITKSTWSKLPNVPNANTLKVTLYIEDALMCCVEHSLEQTEIIK